MFKVLFTSTLSSRKKTEALFLPFFSKKGKNPFSASVLDKEALQLVDPLLKTGDFQGKVKETLLSYSKGSKEPRVAVYGLGEENFISLESIRQSVSQVIVLANQKKLKSLSLVLPSVSQIKNMGFQEFLFAVGEGLCLANYQWKKSKEPISLVEQVHLIGVASKYASIFEKAQTLSEAVHFTRDLVNEGADEINPQSLCKIASGLKKKASKLSVEIFDEKKLKSKGFGLILAVGRGGRFPPALIQMQYKGDPKSKKHIVLVGKGVTFDTGGLNLKPTGSMETMRDDMSGAAAVLGTMKALVDLDLPVNVTALVPTVENGIDAESYKPGDVYQGYSKDFVEVGNTDAEGRLILADALAYAADCLKPTYMIDLATLTGAVVVALGEEVAGMFCNDSELSSLLLKASDSTSELVCQLPLHEPYRRFLDSDIADISNIGGGRPAGSIKAALFLKHFIKDVSWAHFDIGGTAFASQRQGYLPKYGVGFGVRLLINFLDQLSKK